MFFFHQNHFFFEIIKTSFVQSKAGPKAPSGSTPIDNTYVQVYLANDVQKVVQHGASQTSVFPKLEPEHIVLCTKKFIKLREWFVIHLFLI